MNIYQLEERIRQDIAAQRILGMGLAIVQGSEVTYARGFGVTSVEDGSLPVTPQTLFCIGSISKTLTATLVMCLVEQGKLSLDEPVTSYLPGFAFGDVELGKRVTLRHVLSHTTGLPSAGKDFGPRDPDALRRFVWEEIPGYGFVAEPGKVHLYSNTVIVLAGYLAEVVTGKYYDRLVQELIFEPLRMRRSTFDRTVAMTYPLALAHERGEDGVLRTRHRFTDNVSGNPAGFGISSTLDLANFATMHLGGGQFGGTQILSPESVAEMHAQQTSRYTAGAEAGYGLGFYTGEYKGVRQVQHGGMLESYNCYLSLFPDREVGVVLQCNYDSDAASMHLVHYIYDQLLDLPPGRYRPAPAAPARDEWSRRAGSYLSVRSGLASVEIEGEQLVLRQGGKATPLSPVEGDLYLADSAPVGFVPEPDGLTQYLVIHGEPYRRFERDPSFVPDPSSWTRFEGTYAVWEIDPYPIRIRVADGTLFIKWWGDEVPCAPLSDTSFAGERGLIEFEVPQDGGAPVLITGKAARRYRVD